MSRGSLTYFALGAVLLLCASLLIISFGEDSSTSKGKYQEAFESMQLTAEEKAAKPDGVSEANWLATVFFHRANVHEKNGPVEFYGKAVDQDGQPIEGAKITAYSSYYVESLKEQVAAGGGKTESKDIIVTTDANGRFTIGGFRARMLRFRAIAKDGYFSSKKVPTGFSFSPPYSSQHDPDQSSPVLFPMWKKGPTEPLIKKFWRKRAVADGRKYSIDLKNSQIIESDQLGDFQIRIIADYSSSAGTTNYPWSIEIDASACGIIESNDAYLYRAPEKGYVHQIAWTSSAGDGKWSRDITKKLYIKGSDEEFYSSVLLEIKIFHTNSASIEMNILLNPAGSRNLEYDPSKEIRS